MTETDSTKRPLTMPVKFLPYLENYRIYLLFKDMVTNLVVNLPKDHLRHMKVYLGHHLYAKNVDRVILLVEPKLDLDMKGLAKQLIKSLGFLAITRRLVIDHYEKHDDYVAGCMSPVLMSEVTKAMVEKEPLPQTGWLMFDHPCTVREARCLQQDGVLPSVTLVLMKTPPTAPPPINNRTPARNFFQQDFEGLKYAYKATLKEVHIDTKDDLERVSTKCLNAVTACKAAAQGPGQSIHVVGAPGVYRVLVLGPRGSGRRSQSGALAKHFGLVYISFDLLYNQAKEMDNELGERVRNWGTSVRLKADIVRRRLLKKDCIDHGWVLSGYPSNGADFEQLENMPTPPNRIIFLNVDMATCKARVTARGVDWCTGKTDLFGGPRVKRYPQNEEAALEQELDYYFSEALAELRAAAGITSEEIDASEPFETVQVKLQAAVMASPAYDMAIGGELRNVCGD